VYLWCLKSVRYCLVSVKCFLENAMSAPCARQQFVPTSASVLFFAVFLLPLLAACLPAERAAPRQMVLEWAEKHLVYIADERIGGVRAFQLGSGAPVLVAQTRSFERSSVRDIKLDAARGQLWVLGNDGIYLHDAQSLQQLKRIPLDARDVAEMRIEDDGVILLATGGVILGYIDTATRVALWRSTVSVRRG
jgi:hypothetical protein